MNLKKAFTPKDVEELRPSFFVQKKGESYRQVNPLVWNNQWRLKGQIKLRSILMIILIVVLFFTLNSYVKFYEQVNSDPAGFCINVSKVNPLFNYEVNYEDTNTIQIDIPETSGQLGS